MPKYRIIGVMSADKFLGEVEADSKEEALRKAEEDNAINGNAYASLCWQCSGEVNLGDIYEYQAEEVE